MASLAEIRARLAAAETNKSNQSQGGDGAVFAHWNMEEGKDALLRFLPDANQSNPFFWVERAMIRLPFNGVKGEMDTKQVVVQVPCMEMWNETCPILSEVRPWFKDPTLEEMGRKYWKKRSYVFQGFVRENPINEERKPENPIRRFMISPQIFALIKSALIDPELEELPTDYQRGLDFRVTKTAKGGYADYSTSKWSRKETALTSEEFEAIEKYGLSDLSEFMPKRPTEVELRVIKEMFEASVDGQPYDPERWGQYYRPAGMSVPAGTTKPAESAPAARPAAVATPAPAPVASVDDEPPFDTDNAAATPVAESKPAGGQSAHDILAMIRARQQKS